MDNSSIELQEPAKLKPNRGFQPCPAEYGDELYANGIFKFNITRLLAFISAHSERFCIESVELADLPDYGSDRLDQAAIDAADLSRPILLAEIAPGHFNVIDGHHRVARARREARSSIAAHRVRCPEHIAFLTSTRAYETYIEYWNSKLDDSSSRIRRRRRRDQALVEARDSS